MFKFLPRVYIEERTGEALTRLELERKGVEFEITGKQVIKTPREDGMVLVETFVKFRTIKNKQLKLF